MGPRALRAISVLLRVLQLLLALFILSAASLHIYQFSTSGLLLTDGSPGEIPCALYVVEAISFIAAIYAFITSTITCLGHKKIFIFAIVFDLFFTGGFVAVSVLMRGSARQNCSGISYSGNISKGTNNIPSSLYSSPTTNPQNVQTNISPRLLCIFDQASFSLAVTLSISFATTLFLSHLSLRKYKKLRAFGCGSANSTGKKPLRKHSEETAPTNTNTLGIFDAPGFRGTAPGRTDDNYRIPALGLRDSGLEMGENGRFDPSTSVDQRHAERDYKGKDF